MAELLDDPSITGASSAPSPAAARLAHVLGQVATAFEPASTRRAVISRWKSRATGASNSSVRSTARLDLPLLELVDGLVAAGDDAGLLAVGGQERIGRRDQAFVDQGVELRDLRADLVECAG